MNGITINELLRHCLKQVKKGNGNKVIYLSNDDEGNGYHKMYYVFTDKDLQDLDSWGEIEDYDNSVVLG